jgi:molybdopterin molybdotransferase
MMDGFAVRAEDTLGATPYSQIALEVIGQSLPGEAFEGQVLPGQAVRIMTGAPIPTGADAVLQAEYVEIRSSQIVTQTAVAPRKHVGQPGEDIAAGATVLTAPRILRPQDIGVLSSIGVAAVEAVQMPRVHVVTTGNELLPAGSKPQGYNITDANSPMLLSLIRRDGGLATHAGIIPDDPQQILKALMADVDIVVVSGGSSVGQEDHVPMLLAEHGELNIHGVAMRPSSPIGMGRLGKRLVFLLPGNPVSCLCGYDFFVGRAVRLLGGLGRDWPYRKRSYRLQRKLISMVGRVDYARVLLVDGEIEPIATSGASVLSSTTRADGFVVVPEDSEGYAEGSQVDVFLYD